MSTVWRALTETDLLSRLSATELERVRAKAVEMEGDPIADAITQVVDEVRGYIAGNGSVTMGAAGTLPPRLIGVALDILVPVVYRRVGGVMVDLDDQRTKAADEARKLLRDVAAGKFVVTDGASGAEAQDNGAEYSSPATPVSRNDLKGL